MGKILFDKLGVLISTTGTVYNVETIKKFIDTFKANSIKVIKT